MILLIESKLLYDGTEIRQQFIGRFEVDNLNVLNELIDSYWEYENERCMTQKIVDGIRQKIDEGSCSFVYVEDDLTVMYEGCRREFTFVFC